MAGETAFERQLVRDGVVDDARLHQAREHASRVGVALSQALVETGAATAEAVYRSLADFCEMRFVAPSKMDIPHGVVAKVPARFATHYSFVPIQERNGTIVVAVSDPLDHQLLDDIRLVLKKQRVEMCVATPEEIVRATKALYGVGADTVERILSESDSTASVLTLDGGTDLGDDSLDASIIKFVNELLAEAIRSGATDIHLEPFEDQLRLRYRIDGVLHGVPTPPSIRGFQPAIVSRLKIMANLNIAEKRLPQDGKIRASLGEEQFDLRVSVLPTPHGETVNLRILNRSSMFMTLEQLGFTGDDLTVFNTFLTRPHGMILVTGPTGSGKTTTLYAALSKLNKLEHKIITIEDPIEYQLKGITQMQTMPQIGFDFTSALRSMLRHDPDVMLVGEIRDYETAEMAIRSSLTGHLVFSTLHTNDAAGAVTRLVDMGVEPFLIASTMIASLAQRLVRCICVHCAEPFTPSSTDYAQLGKSPKDGEGATFRRGRGCDACRNTGYHGRIAIYELLPFTNEIKDMTIRREPSTHIKRRAMELGMRTLRSSGWQRVREGKTTFEEVVRVTAESDMFDTVES
ncbi:MAG: ATPase, T2SS/T4P/T4SS family [Candidatus Hydrogenedentes bacterium]|nr:ATPase, T2SS/T4P/T4SS family [Candidatus Hydrogenedentota bacterium]